MKEKCEILKVAEKLIDERKKSSLLLSEKRKEEIFEKFPKYKELDNDIAKNGMQMMKYAAKGFSAKDKVDELNAENMSYAAEMENILVKNGYPKDYITRTSSCEKCGDRGYVFDDAGREVMCDCLKKEFSKIALEESEIPAKYTLKDFDISLFSEKDKALAGKIYDMAKTLAENPDNTFNKVFVGRPGTGKSFVSEIIGTELSKKGKYVLYVTTTTMLQCLTYYGDDERLTSSRDKLMRIVKDADLLIIDDLGTEKISAARFDILINIIDYRTSVPTKSTIVSTNLYPKEILATYGERMFSRLSGMGMINFEFSETKDLRLKK